ncbi:hypothetical protein CFP56_038984 [Quercus suber]|uniref:Uncharacterized protein n=1 Tax=Quercus suber TaxID=58331 RepID=A0AAW0J134_QUESU|nr:hypothetical protein CFP56_25022 [Quercus suber]
MEDTSPPRSRAALFLEQLREIDQEIKEFDILKEENKGKENHVVYNKRVSVSHGGPQMKQSLNLGSEKMMKAHTVLKRRGGVTNKVDGPINSPVLQKETLSPRETVVKHKEARVLAQTSTYGSLNTFILEGVRCISDNQLSHNNTLGKENIIGDSTVIKTNGGRCAETMDTWKCIPRESVEGKDRVSGEKAVGAKRKDVVPLKEIQQNIFNEKRSKMEVQVLTMGQLMAKHLGAAEVAKQPRRDQCVPLRR